MDIAGVLAAFDEQVRHHPEPAAPDESIECEPYVTRSVPTGPGWAGVIWSGLSSGNADEVIAAEVSRFAQIPGPWEWKHYSYDEPADLPARLLAAGFRPEPPEALMVAEIASLSLEAEPPPGVGLADVTDEAGVAALVRVHDEVFGGDHAAIGEVLLTGLRRRPPAAGALVAMAGDRPVSAGRVEFGAGTQFASLWGGGTLPEWRGKGIFRALVARRAAIAQVRGFRYLQVDATPDSEPILARLGFAKLATTTPYTHE